MVSTPFGPYGQDDYFDQYKFDKFQEIFKENTGRGMSFADVQDLERRSFQSPDEVAAYAKTRNTNNNSRPISAAEAKAYVEKKKPVAKPTPSAAKKTAAKKPTPKPTAKKAPPKKK